MDMLMWKGENFMGVIPLDKELQRSDDFWDRGNSLLPGMSSLTGCPM